MLHKEQALWQLRIREKTGLVDGVIGAVLAGGLARRMGGGDKGLLRLAGRPILARAIERLAPQCRAVVLNANGDPSRFAAFGLPVVPDDVPGHAGPLAGVLAVLDHAAERHPEAGGVVTVTADAPFLPVDLVSRLREGRGREAADIACAASGGRPHPAIALWPVGLRAELRRALVVDGERRVSRFAARHRVATVAWEGAPDPFFNVNTPGDLAEAEALIALIPGLSGSGT